LETIDANGSGSTVVLDDDPRIGMALWWASDGRVLYAYREGRRAKETIMEFTRSG
jgi:hypothetical protein